MNLRNYCINYQISGITCFMKHLIGLITNTWIHIWRTWRKQNFLTWIQKISLSVLLFPSDIIDCGPSLIKSKGIIFINSLHILFCWTDHFSWKSWHQTKWWLALWIALRNLIQHHSQVNITIILIQSNLSLMYISVGWLIKTYSVFHCNEREKWRDTPLR